MGCGAGIVKLVSRSMWLAEGVWGRGTVLRGGRGAGAVVVEGLVPLAQQGCTVGCLKLCEG